MFDSTDRPRVFGTPLGVDFPKALVNGLIARHRDQPPERLARVQLIVNTRRMQRRIRTLFDQGPALLLPRIDLVTDLGEHWDLAHIPDPISPLRRRLELTQLISALLEKEPDLAPRASLYDLADSLAALMDEMHGEGVSPDAIDDLNIADQSGHWERIKTFLGIIRHYFDHKEGPPDVETRQRMVIERLVEDWRVAPPKHPVIIAGSTGSRGATQMLMQAIAQLPQGAAILPGFDFDMSLPVWSALDDAMSSEDHPQYRFAHFMGNLNLKPEEVEPWTADRPTNPARNELLSLALRPAPVTDEWLRDGPKLTDISAAMQDVTLLEAPNQRIEALTIAMRLRQAAEEGQTAALITPDRMLTRRVAAALDRWSIIPDDSAGMPLHLSPPGRFLRHVADLFRQRLSTELLLSLLKHPLTHSGADRGPHLRLTRELELHLRRYGSPYPSSTELQAWAAGVKDKAVADWIAWVCECFVLKDGIGEQNLSDQVNAHLALANRISQGAHQGADHALWQGDAGREALKTVSNLAENAIFGGSINASDYGNLFQAILARQDVRNPDAPHPNILIWGTLEARVQGADLLILAGLNEGGWPETPKPDPWLNRALRHQAGLLLPERRIGLSAHDFQQAATANEVWFTRSIRSDDAETVASRWVNRIQNLLSGLSGQNGPDVLKEMRNRGQFWLNRASLLERTETTLAAPRPAPCPPVAARPHSLSVTEIKRLIRDPYAIYAKHVLRLRPLDPLMKAPDALLRGTVLHKVLEEFVRETRDDLVACTREALLLKTETILAQNVPWAEAQAIWRARMARVVDWFIDGELGRRALAYPTAFEAGGQAAIPALKFTLTSTADRIDIDRAGNLHIYDYKTGSPPSPDEQTYFDKQLLLEAAIAEQYGFGELDLAKVARAVFIGLSGAGKEVDAPLESEPPDKIWGEFQELIQSYMDPAKGYAARRAMHSKRDHSDYDQLARFGEWDITDDADAQGVG